jgi:hypothetical protein
MPDPIYKPEAYILAHDIVRHIEQDLAIQFQMDGDKWDRDAMQKHVNERAALIRVSGLILDAGERAAGLST